MTRFLVTGASGLLGLNFCLQTAGEHTVFGVVHQHALKGVPFTVLSADLSQPGEVERIVEQAQPEVILHCAALANLDACEANPELAEHLNARVPGELAQAAKRLGARLVHISTDAVFDGQSGNYCETDLPHPINTYARTKLAGEHKVADSDPQALIARVNFYGWSLKGVRSLGEWFVNNLSAGRYIYGFTDVFFCPLLVQQLSEILIKAVEKRLSGIYHVVSSESLSKDDFGRRLAHQFKLDETLITPVSWKVSGLQAVRSPDLTLNSTKLAEAFGETLPGQASGIQRFHELYLQGYPQQVKSYLQLGLKEQH